MTYDALPPVATPAAPPEVTPARRCPWCSELLPVDATSQCPHCHANLTAGGETHLPGVTEVEPPSATKARRESARRSKLLSWISGEIDDEALVPMSARPSEDAFAPPPKDVRREMLRLQLEAEGVTVAPDGSLAYPAVATDEEFAAGDAAFVDEPATGASDATDADPTTPDATEATAPETDAPAEIRKAS